MKKTFRVLSAVLAALMITACSREGFEESLNRPKESGKSKGSQKQQAVEVDPEEFIFDLDTDEYEKDNCLYYYALPRAASAAAEKSAEKIAAELEELISSLPEKTVKGRELESMSVYDAITLNDGKMFSVMYEIEVSLADGTEENYAMGLVFDPVTGERMPLDEIKSPDTLVTLLLDEQSSKIPGKKEEIKAKKRAYLSEQGDKKLKKRLLAVGTVEELLDASFYIDGSDLAVLIAADQDIGGVIEVSVNI